MRPKQKGGEHVSVVTVPSGLLLPAEAARMIGNISVRWVQHLADTGRLPHVRSITGVRLLLRGPVEDFARKRRAHLARKPA